MNQERVDKAIERLKLGAELSQIHYKQPLIICYSGGKDSDVLLDLAFKAGIEFEVINNHTTCDAPETVYHIRDKIEECNDKGIKAQIVQNTYADGRPKTMWNLIIKKGFAPTRLIRYCCSELKENTAYTRNRIIATGVRWDESVRRKATREEFETIGKTPSDKITTTAEKMLITDNDESRQFVEKCELKAKTVVNPIIDWVDDDIWDYIKENNLKINPLYEQGFSRVGCIGCPVAGKKGREIEFRRYPKYKLNYIRTFDKMQRERERAGKKPALDKYFPNGATGQNIFDWWLENGGQMSIDDFEIQDFMNRED